MEKIPNWENAKHLLGEFYGAATEINVVGLPLSHLPEVLTTIGELPTLEITSFADAGLENPEPFDRKWHYRLESLQDRTCQHALRSANGTSQHLQIYLWINGEEATLEVGLVFWNDLTFPQDLGTQELEKRLSALVSLAEACRATATSAQCILSEEHNGSTEELLSIGSEFRIIW